MMWDITGSECYSSHEVILKQTHKGAAAAMYKRSFNGVHGMADTMMHKADRLLRYETPYGIRAYGISKQSRPK